MECHAPTARVEALRPVYRPVLERMVAEFSQLPGMTPHAFLVETRAQAARSMMRADAHSLAGIRHTGKQ